MINWKSLDINYSAIGHRFELTPDNIGLAPLFKKVLERGSGCVHKFYREGYTEVPFTELTKKITDAGGRLVFEQKGGINGSGGDDTIDQLYVWDDAILEIDTSKSKLISVGAVSMNEKVVDLCKELTISLAKQTKKGYVFAIVQENSALNLARIGFAGSQLERGNYTQEVLEGYDYAIEDLNSKDPSGRIVILDGSPGVGKSWMIRSLLMDVKKAMFVIVPPSMVQSMGGPELLPLLLRTKENYRANGPIILVLEDADECLAPRGADNINSISAILNLGDGILGSLFDVRIVATTNAKYKDLDDAVVRDMRLSKRIEIKSLSYTDANKVFKRLIKNEEKDLPIPEAVGGGMKPLNKKSSFSLAEVYKAARDVGWRPEKKEEKSDDGGTLKSYDDGEEPWTEEDYYDGSEYM